MENFSQEISSEAPKVFGSRWSQAWLDENKHWMIPEFVEVVERSLNKVPIGSDYDYFERIDARVAAMD